MSTAVSERPRVLHIGKFYPPHRGGMESHLALLCSELQKHVDVCVLVSNEHRTTRREMIDGVEVHRLGTAVRLGSTSLSPSMVRAIRASGADLIHLHWPNPAAVMACLASGHKGPFVVTYHSDVVRQRFLGRLFEPALHAILRRSSVIIATSAEYIQSSTVLSSHRQRCHIVPFGIPQQSLSAAETAAVAQLRQLHGDRLILSVGRLVYYKGFEYLIEAMTSVEGRLLIVGEGPLRSKLEALAVRRGVDDRVTIISGCSDRQLLHYYHAADMFVLASVERSEAFGIVQIEAMAAGKPVINTSLNSGVPSVSVDGVTGITVPPRDPASLAAAINRLLDDETLRLCYGCAARVRAKAEFTVEKMVAGTLDAYQAALGVISRRARAACAV